MPGELAESVDLIVVLSMGKGAEFIAEVINPCGFTQEEEIACFNFGEAAVEPLFHARDWSYHERSWLVFDTQILIEGMVAAGFLQYHHVSPVALVQVDYHTPEIRKIESFAEHVEQIPLLLVALESPSSAH